MKIIGIICLALAALAFAAGSSMDTTVETSMGGRVHNIGRLAEQKNTLNAAGVLAIVGALFIVFGRRNKNSNSPAQAGPVAKTRKCPYCAEEVLAEAIRCKHCQADLEPVKEETIEEAADRLGVKRAGHLFLFQDYQYTRLEDAVDYAKRARGESRG